MARGDDVSADEKVNRSVRRTLTNLLVVLVVLGGLAAWSVYGGFYYTLEPGQSGIILRLGELARTETEPGFHLQIPWPIETLEVVAVDQLEREDFGVRGVDEAEASRQAVREASMQTSDNNLVRLSFVVQYKIKDAFQARYRVAEPRQTLRDAAQAAVREVVGRMSIDGVLSERRGDVEFETEQILQEILDAYESGLVVTDVSLQEVQPPPEVRAAFDDVIGAAQDASRTVNEAEGYKNELLPRARAEAAELVAGAAGYREAVIAEATGEAERFKAVALEYEKAPQITQRRLYLETMEKVLPEVEKVIIEPGTANVLPYLPLGRRAEVAPPPPSPASAPAPETGP